MLLSYFELSVDWIIPVGLLASGTRRFAQELVAVNLGTVESTEVLNQRYS